MADAIAIVSPTLIINQRFLEGSKKLQKINAKKTYLIHMTHNLEYDSLKKMLPEGVYVGYDGLKLQIN